MNDFSIKQYIVDNKLADEEGHLLASPVLPDNPAWGLGPYNRWEAKIYLCTLIHFFEHKGMLDNLSITIEDMGDKDYTIYVDEIDRCYDYAHPNFDWGIVMDTVEFLLPHMASSNISYLSEMIFFDN